jgi:hypothetical protein
MSLIKAKLMSLREQLAEDELELERAEEKKRVELKREKEQLEKKKKVGK